MKNKEPLTLAAIRLFIFLMMALLSYSFLSAANYVSGSIVGLLTVAYGLRAFIFPRKRDEEQNAVAHAAASNMWKPDWHLYFVILVFALVISAVFYLSDGDERLVNSIAFPGAVLVLLYAILRIVKRTKKITEDAKQEFQDSSQEDRTKS